MRDLSEQEYVEGLSEEELEERNEFQKRIIKQTERLYSLSEIAKITGISYKTLWTYSQAGIPELEAFRRYADQLGPSSTGKPYKTDKWAQGAIRVVRKIKEDHMRNRGNTRKKSWLDNPKLKGDDEKIEGFRERSKEIVRKTRKRRKEQRKNKAKGLKE